MKAMIFCGPDPRIMTGIKKTIIMEGIAAIEKIMMASVFSSMSGMQAAKRNKPELRSCQW
jgi:hypothetical protein